MTLDELVLLQEQLESKHKMEMRFQAALQGVDTDEWDDNESDPTHDDLWEQLEQIEKERNKTRSESSEFASVGLGYAIAD